MKNVESYNDIIADNEQFLAKQFVGYEDQIKDLLG